MHPLAHAWARDNQTPETQQQSWIDAGCLLVTTQAFLPVTKSLLTEGFIYLPDCFSESCLRSYISVSVKTALSYGHENVVWPILLACTWTMFAHRVQDEFDDFRNQLREMWPVGLQDPMQSIYHALGLEWSKERSTLDLAPGTTDDLYACFEQVVAKARIEIQELQTTEAFSKLLWLSGGRPDLVSRMQLEEAESRLKSDVPENDLALLTIQSLLLQVMAGYDEDLATFEGPNFVVPSDSLFDHLNKPWTVVLSDIFPPHLAYIFLICMSDW
jgi:hypothetical protein